MTFQEISLWVAAAVLALIALFWLIGSLFNLLHPRVTVPFLRLIIDAVVIAVCGASAYGIFINFLR